MAALLTIAFFVLVVVSSERKFQMFLLQGSVLE